MKIFPYILIIFLFHSSYQSSSNPSRLPYQRSHREFPPWFLFTQIPRIWGSFMSGCAHLESIYIVDGHLKLCKKFALALWNATTEEELKLPTKRFDNCGFLVPDETEQISINLSFKTGTSFLLKSQEGY